MRIPDVFVLQLTFPDLDWERVLPDDEARPYMDNIANNRRRSRHVEEDYPNKHRRVQYGKETSREREESGPSKARSPKPGYKRSRRSKTQTEHHEDRRSLEEEGPLGGERPARGGESQNNEYGG